MRARKPHIKIVRCSCGMDNPKGEPCALCNDDIPTVADTVAAPPSPPHKTKEKEPKIKLTKKDRQFLKEIGVERW